MADERDRFSGAAECYARFRPGYPEALLDWLAREARLLPGARVLDVGCGTGIFSRLLHARGFDVLGLDPNADMLAQARAAGGPLYLRAEAAATGVASGAFSLVTVAQAFHWLDPDATLAEFARVLRGGGLVAAIYNLRGESAFNTEYEALVRRFSSETRVAESWEKTLRALESHPRALAPRRHEVPHVQPLTREGLRGRAWSSSYVFRGVRDREGFDRALDALHAAHARAGRLDLPYRAVALVFALRAEG